MAQKKSENNIPLEKFKRIGDLDNLIIKIKLKKRDGLYKRGTYLFKIKSTTQGKDENNEIVTTELFGFITSDTTKGYFGHGTTIYVEDIKQVDIASVEECEMFVWIVGRILLAKHNMCVITSVHNAIKDKADKFTSVEVEWDTDGESLEDCGLPKIVQVPNDVDEECVSDWLSDRYGYCVYGWTCAE